MNIASYAKSSINDKIAKDTEVPHNIKCPGEFEKLLEFSLKLFILKFFQKYPRVRGIQHLRIFILK